MEYYSNTFKYIIVIGSNKYWGARDAWLSERDIEIARHS